MKKKHFEGSYSSIMHLHADFRLLEFGNRFRNADPWFNKPSAFPSPISLCHKFMTVRAGYIASGSFSPFGPASAVGIPHSISFFLCVRNSTLLPP